MYQVDLFALFYLDQYSYLFHFQVPRGNYTQIRVSGFGYGDVSLESAISQVQLYITFQTDLNKTIQSKLPMQKFDLMVFERGEDYLCYVEAVHRLIHEGVTKNCTFLYTNSQDYFGGITEKSFQNHIFLRKQDRTREYFFVIDNTDYPEVLLDPNFKRTHNIFTNNKGKDAFVRITTSVTYTANQKYKEWSFVFMIILTSLITMTVLSISYWCRQTYIYNTYANERK